MPNAHRSFSSGSRILAPEYFPMMIRLASVSKTYAASPPQSGGNGGAVHALRSVSLEIASGEFVAIVGPSGCGKSTLLHIAGGLDAPTEGEVWINGQPLHEMNERGLSLFRRKSVGVVFQFFNLLPQLTALENVCLPLRLLGISFAESQKRAETLLERVGLRGKEGRLPAELSGGEQQRVAIARALAHQPKVVLADEPTGNLDSKAAEIVLEILKDLQAEHQTALLMATHSREISKVAHRSVALQDGLIVN